MFEIQDIFQILGGVAFITYGIHLSGVNLQKLLGSKLENILRRSAEHPFKGVLIGSATTSLIHSSGTTAIMLMGLMSEGVITLSMAVPVLLGANIGSTVATQLASFRVGGFALALFTIGALLHIAVNRKNIMKLGEAIIGFSFLFLGMELIFSGVAGMAYERPFIYFIDLISANSLMAVVCAILATFILQSTTVVSIIVLAMGIAGIADLNLALLLILGVNLGGSLKVVNLALRGKNFPVILSMLHLVFNIFGLIIFLYFFEQFSDIVTLTSGDIGHQIANAYTLYHVINAAIVLPLVPFFVYFVHKLSPNKSIRRSELFYLDRKLICTPSVSINLVNRGAVEMARMAYEMLEMSEEIFFGGKSGNMKVIEYKESRIDYMTEKISEYIVQIYQQNLSRADTMRLYSLMHVVADIEHLCDHIVTVAECFVKAREKRVTFSEKAGRDLIAVYGKIRIMQNLTIKSLEEDNAKLANEIIQHENKVDEIIKKIISGHLSRIESGECSAEAGEYFSEALYNLERVGDHYDNVAYAIADRFNHNERIK